MSYINHPNFQGYGDNLGTFDLGREVNGVWVVALRNKIRITSVDRTVIIGDEPVIKIDDIIHVDAKYIER